MYAYMYMQTHGRARFFLDRRRPQCYSPQIRGPEALRACAEGGSETKLRSSRPKPFHTEGGWMITRGTAGGRPKL